MTDVIFLLLIFFMFTSTFVVPNSIQVLLPRSQQQTQAKPITRVTIDKDLNYYVANANETERQVSFEDITPFLQSAYSAIPVYSSHSMRMRPYPIGDCPCAGYANQNQFKMVLMTRPN
jgi:biopolymer transport protein ExbD